MSQTWNALAGGRRLLLLALVLTVAPAAARAQQQKPEELAAKAKAILTKYCFECHGKDPNKASAKKLKVLDYAGMLASRQRLLVPKAPDESLLIQRLESTDEPMPPEGKPQPSDAERKALRAWVAAGAADFTKKVQVAVPAKTETGPTPPAPPKAADLALQAKAVLTKYCFDCHGKDPNRNSAKKLKVLDYPGMLASKKKVLVPNAPDDSLLIKRLESKDDPMPPEGKPQPSDPERKVLRAWVAAGAPNFGVTASVPPTPPTATNPAITPVTTTAPTANFEEELLKQAAITLDFLRQKGCKTVGVLKFRVQRLGEAEATDNAGPLNLTLATRLELAMALANDDKNPIAVIRDASRVADVVPNGNHLYRAGREKLFGRKYPLAWGKDDPQLVPDAFVTGVVRFSPDLARMGITLLAFDKEVDKVYKQEEFYVACDPDLLVEAGESYLLRDVLKDKQPLAPAKAVKAAFALHKEEVVSPLLDQKAPVRLEVRYDGKPVQVKFENGKFLLPEAKEGQKVSFVVQRLAAADDRLAVVLKVNGQSTLFRETLPDVQCRKWVLEPGVASLTIDRIQTDIKDDKGDLVVQAVPRSKPDQFRYTPDVGTVSVVVFREAKGTPVAREGAEDQAAIGRAAYPKEQANDLASLKELLRKEGAQENAAHSLAAPEKEGGEIKEVEFKADPTPVMALTMICQRP
jgi:mono/diheme cytochrome c family protein